MKFYRYKQVQRLTFFGYDDILKLDNDSLLKTSEQTGIGINFDTKRLRFDVNKIASVQLSHNARIVLESVYLPTLAAATRNAPFTVRMNNLNSNSYDSENKGYNTTLVYTNDITGTTFQNTSENMLYNFNIDQHFFKNGYIDFQITYPNDTITLASFSRFYISLVVYDVNEEELLLKDTPEVDFKKFGAHYNNNNGRIPK
jgi:hypothetical protein